MAMCDFGYLDQGQDFRLATMNTPNNFNGRMLSGDAMRVQVGVSAQNKRPRKPIVVEVIWDGQWVGDPNAMRGHFVVKKENSLI